VDARGIGKGKFTMIPPRIRKYLGFSQLVTSIASLLFGMTISIASNFLSDQWSKFLPYFGGATLVALGLSFWVWLHKPAGMDILIRAPRTVTTEAEALRYARRGFISFVPLFTQHGPPSENLAPDERELAIKNLDFEKLHFEKSNLAPTIKAILTHASQLEHCWLLSTTSKNGPGTQKTARLLAEYLKQNYKLSCQFHYGDDLCVTMDEDTEILQKTYDIVKEIFEKAERSLGILGKEMVVNITTGVRSMTLGMVLACLDGERDIEFIGTKYDDNTGKPTGDLLPITFSFEASGK
jgi:hypothetical protein